MTVQEIINGIIKKTELEPIQYDKTCDHLMTGDPDQEVSKIATTFMATVEVIEKAAEMGVNFIITHEPTWFTGMDDTNWVRNDQVYLKKKELIEKNKIAIWRFHDHMHMEKDGDGIYRGFDIKTGWGGYHIPNAPGMEHFGCCYEIPEITLAQLADFFKERFGMDVIQIVGNAQTKIKRVGVLVGGGSLGLGTEEMPMKLMKDNQLDLAICGDITEWTLSAYVRDAAALGMNKAMLVLGHERSEEAGMEYLGEWLKDITADIPVLFIDAGEPFGYL